MAPTDPPAAPPARPEGGVPHQLRFAAAVAWRFLVVATAVAIVALALARLRVVVLPVVVALFLAAALAPPAGWLRRLRFPPALAALTIVVGTILLFAGAVTFLAPRAVDELADVRVNVEAGIETVTTWLLEGPLDLSREQLDRWRERALDEARARASSVATGAIGGAYVVVELVAGLLLTVVVLFFFLKDGDRIWPAIVRLFPRQARDRVDEVGRSSWRLLGRYLRGLAVVALVDAVFIGLALWLIGVPLVLPLALLTFIGGFFPIVGAFTAGVAAALVALVTGGVVDALLVVGATLLVQQLEGNVLQPFIVGRAVQLHPLAVLLAVAAGGVVWGIPGAFLAVPLAAVLSSAASQLRGDEEPAGASR